MNKNIRIGLFGRVSASCEGVVFTAFATRKAAELLMILAVHHEQPVPRKYLIGLLWPGSSGPKANNRLSATLYLLRKALEEEFADCGAGAICSGDGTIWLSVTGQNEFLDCERLWLAYGKEQSLTEKTVLAEKFCEMYRGHLGGSLPTGWFEPLQSLWASRWTECVLWRVESGSISLDQGLEVLTKAQPILPVTSAVVTAFLDRNGRGDLASSWEKQPVRVRTTIQRAVVSYRKYVDEESSVLARRPTMTAIVVESGTIPSLRALVDHAGPEGDWIGHPQIFCARNPLFARRLATRIRQRHPLARIYLSTEVADAARQDDSRLLGWLDEIEPGETLMNSAAAALLEQHDRSIVMERAMGRSEYRLH